MTMKKFLAKNEIMETYEVTLSDDQYKEMRNNLLDNCGEHYAMMQNIGIFIVDKIRKLGVSISNPWKQGMNCSELVYRFVVPYICDMYHDTEPDLIKPSEIRDILGHHEIVPIFSKL